MLFRILLVFLYAVSSVSAEQLDANPLHWLEKMSNAMKTLEYQGTLVFVKNGRLDTMRFFHTINNGLPQERLLSLNSPMREVIREAGKVRCIFKNTNKVVVNHRPVSKSFIVDLPDDFSAVKDIYQYSLKGEESVAMLSAQIVSIESKDDFRYGRTIWIDKQHFLPLKVEVYNAAGETLDQVVFTELRVGTQAELDYPESKIEKPQILNVHQERASIMENAAFFLVDIPVGFKTVFYTQMDAGLSAQPVEHLLLSDGFSSISVYREAKSESLTQGLQTLGTINSFTHNIDNFQITVMGEVPASSVQLIAQGVKFR